MGGKERGRGALITEYKKIVLILECKHLVNEVSLVVRLFHWTESNGVMVQCYVRLDLVTC